MRVGGCTQVHTGSCHAEAMAIAWLLTHRHRFKYWKRLELIVYRYSEIDGTLRNAKPCVHCTALIKRAVEKYHLNITKVTYSTDESTFVTCPVQDLKSTYLTPYSREVLREKQMTTKLKMSAKLKR